MNNTKYMIVKPVHGNAYLEEIEHDDVVNQGFKLNVQYFEPIHEVYFIIIDDLLEAQKRVREHQTTWN